MPMDRSKYPTDWESISQRIRFDRAKGRCEKCGSEYGEPNPETGSVVVLTVAHLNHEPSDCRDENLMAMCQACHIRYDAPRKADERRYGKGVGQGRLVYGSGGEIVYG